MNYEYYISIDRSNKTYRLYRKHTTDDINWEDVELQLSEWEWYIKERDAFSNYNETLKTGWCITSPPLSGEELQRISEGTAFTILL